MATRRKPEEQTVRVAPLGELRAYTISEHELEKLEQGTPVSDLFTIGVCLLSAALTVLVTVLSTPLPENRFTLFFRSLLIFSLVGAICTFLGWRGRTSTRDLAGQIRSRMRAAPAIQQLPSAAPGEPLPTGPQQPSAGPAPGPAPASPPTTPPAPPPNP